MEEYARFFKVLGDATRLRIIRLLLEADRGICVCELVDALALPKYTVSRHLSELRKIGLIRERREGKWVLYSIERRGDNFKNLLFKAVMAIPDVYFEVDVERLRIRLAMRKEGRCVVGLKRGGGNEHDALA